VGLPSCAEQLQEAKFTVKPETSPQYIELSVVRFKTTQRKECKSTGWPVLAEQVRGLFNIQCAVSHISLSETHPHTRILSLPFRFPLPFCLSLLFFIRDKHALITLVSHCNPTVKLTQNITFWTHCSVQWGTMKLSVFYWLSYNFNQNITACTVSSIAYLMCTHLLPTPGNCLLHLLFHKVSYYRIHKQEAERYVHLTVTKTRHQTPSYLSSTHLTSVFTNQIYIY
jgi:hypothetical protein